MGTTYNCFFREMCHITTAAGARPNMVYSRSRDLCLCEQKTILKQKVKAKSLSKKNTKNENDDDSSDGEQT